MGPLGWGFGVLLSAALLAAGARAQAQSRPLGEAGPGAPALPPAATAPLAGPPASAAGAVTLPRVIRAPVQYPAAGRGSARVVLELLIDVAGAVAEARPIAGEEPFASAALSAARRFRFEPARAGGQPRAARIRFEVRFSPPEVGGSSPDVEPSAPSARLLAAPAQVRVTGRRAPLSRGMTRAEVQRLPGAFGDPFRAVSAMPGVGSLVTGLPVFFVRGAPPGNVGYLIDGIRVPLLYHAFLGPSVIHPLMIERVDLYAGGYPARLGRFAGGVVEASLAEPEDELVLDASVRLVDAGLFAETPISSGRGHVALAGRYSYTALVLSALTNAELEYWDYQALVSHEVTRGGTLSVFALGAFDFASVPPDAGEAEGDGQNAVLFHRLDLRFDQSIGDHTKFRLAATGGVDATRGSQGLVRNVTTGGRFELRSRLDPELLLRAGASTSIDRYELSLDANTENYLDVLELFPSRTDWVVGGYLDCTWTPLPTVVVTPGLRVDHYRSQGNRATAVSPRLAASFEIADGWTLEHALGLSHQPPNFVPGVPGVAVAGLPGGLQRSVQTSSGVSAELSPVLRASATAFYNAYFRLTDPFSLSQDLDLDAEEARVRATGRTVGLELAVERRMQEGWGGMIGYTLSRSMRSHGRIRTLSGYDRPHVLNLAASHDLGRHWQASARTLFYSGVPGRRTLGARRVFDQERARPFFRLDLKIEKRFSLGEQSFIALTAEVVNATLSKEVLRRPCEPDCRDVVVGPIVLPSVGVSGRL